jgi:type II secretion system protein C
MPPAKAKRLLERAVASLAAALITAFALTCAGPNSAWFEQLKRWLHPPAHVASLHEATKSRPMGVPITVTPMRPVGNDSSVSQAPLPLILVRTQLGRNSREGLAQIGINARSPQTYAAGALLANGARLTEIYAHYVVLERDGHSAPLYLQGEAQASAKSNTSLLTVGGPAAPPPAIADSQDRLTNYLRPNPVFVGSELHGYALSAGRDSFPFSQLGLEAGDVLTQINGVAVTNPAESLAALHTLLDGAALTVTLERQGIPQVLSLDGSILAKADLERSSPTSDSGIAQTQLSTIPESRSLP